MELVTSIAERDKALEQKTTGLEARGAGGNTGSTNLKQFAWRP